MFLRMVLVTGLRLTNEMTWLLETALADQPYFMGFFQFTSRSRGGKDYRLCLAGTGIRSFLYLLRD